jgi:hypothetical protein
VNREDTVKEIAEYFLSDHWRRLWGLLQQPDPQGIHIHHAVDTSIHPESLQSVVCHYLEMKGHPNTRTIDWGAPAPIDQPNRGILHGIEPKGLPHFDIFFTCNPAVALIPSPGEHGENGCNLLSWNRTYMDEFYRDFNFRNVGSAEEKALQEYFKSEHWHLGLKIAALPSIYHIQINTYSSVHPDVIQRFAEDSLGDKGWEIYYTTHEVFLNKGKYTGKLTFMGKNPEKVWDLCWQFDPDAVIRPAEDTAWRLPMPFYGIMPLSDVFDLIERNNLTKLENKEVKQINEYIRSRVQSGL